MAKSSAAAAVGGAMLGAAVVGTSSGAFTVANFGKIDASAATTTKGQRFLAARTSSEVSMGGLNVVGGCALAAAGLAAATVTRRSRRSSAAVSSASSVVSVGLSSSVAAPQESYFRDQLVARRAELQESGAPSPEETDAHMKEIEAYAKQALAGAAAAMFFTSSMESAVAYPIFAQQNYANPREYSGKIVCANCHLASKLTEARIPQSVLPDTIFKAQIDIPAKYGKRMQPIADGSKAKMNVGAIAIMPEGWRLAPKDRLPKVLKKEMKGLSWSPYSKEYPNIVVAGPVPGETFEQMVLPILTPDPNTNDKVFFGKGFIYFGGNRGRGQVYPEGNQSNNNQFFAEATGKVTAIDGLSVSITNKAGDVRTQQLLPGADIVVEVGEEVTKGDPITTNPNVGGFGQIETETILQDMNRIYAYCGIAFSLFICQLTLVLKKKQFEKVQLAEGF
eukprot:TRINITY_DN331_c0_g1_i15.p1 TRINITY_DN331_c0_g1~~TRINITY_DN331_c0_g1_i15.p1  ORF type:complete len:449 (-),score=98.19 TRINITY_DN331_c0_g1_i15:230-1576(-)